MFSITEERIDKLWHLRLNQYLIDHSIRHENPYEGQDKNKEKGVNI